MPSKYYVTTPIYYVNARPHIGHAYTTIVADVLARRHRLLGDRTWFLTGTDEHGQKIERSAAAAGIAPQQFADEVSSSFRALWDRMGLTYDQYIRTTDAAHARGVQQLFRALFENGKIYLSSYTGQYCVSEEMFVEGPPGTIGPDGRPTETVTEENFFFRLSDYQLPLLDLIESGELSITPESRKNEVLSFLRGDVKEVLSGLARLPQIVGLYDPTAGPDMVMNPDGENSELRWALTVKKLKQSAAGVPYVPGALKDLSISRSSFTWGIPVPDDIQREAGATQKHIVYVWLDALANYITAIGYGDPSPEAQARFAELWPAELHLVGKEIIRFHCVYWPAFLLAAGLPLPKSITAHGWLLFDDSKMSKSKGNIVRTETILEAFGTLCPPPPPVRDHQASDPAPRGETADPHLAAPGTAAEPTPRDRDLFAADVLRYFLLREIPFGQDGSFTFDALVTRYNADLANGYGNLVSRTLAMIQKASGGVIEDCPEARGPFQDHADGSLNISEGQLLASRSPEIVARVAQALETFAFADALTAIYTFLGWTDQFITARKPWAATDTEASQAGRRSTLYTAAEAIRILTGLLHPILPFSTANVWRQLGLGDIAEADLSNLQWGGLEPGTRLGPLGPVFPRADKGLSKTMSDMEAPNRPANAAHDARTPTTSDFPEAPLASASAVPEKKPLSRLVDETSGHTSLSNPAGTDPAAGPRTSSMPEPGAAQQVAASAALTTERPGTPPHAEAPASGIFAGEATPQIGIDDFSKVELRMAKVVVCERIPKADKLLRLEVDLGSERRQILSGIAEWYTPEDLLGRRIVVITNLAPRKMRGLESHGMLLAASGPEGGKPALATFADNDDLPLGARLK